MSQVYVIARADTWPDPWQELMHIFKSQGPEAKKGIYRKQNPYGITWNQDEFRPPAALGVSFYTDFTTSATKWPLFPAAMAQSCAMLGRSSSKAQLALLHSQAIDKHQSQLCLQPSGCMKLERSENLPCWGVGAQLGPGPSREVHMGWLGNNLTNTLDVHSYQ